MTKIDGYPIYDQNGWKTLPFGTEHTYIACIRKYSPPGQEAFRRKCDDTTTPQNKAKNKKIQSLLLLWHAFLKLIAPTHRDFLPELNT